MSEGRWVVREAGRPRIEALVVFPFAGNRIQDALVANFTA